MCKIGFEIFFVYYLYMGVCIWWVFGVRYIYFFWVFVKFFEFYSEINIIFYIVFIIVNGGF